MKEASGDAALFISADGQEDPRCLKAMLDKWSGGAKVVWALRKNRDDEPWHIRVSARIFYKIQEWFNRDEYNKVDLYRADFYLLDKVVVDAVNSCPEKNTSIFGLISWLGFNQECVEYERCRRKYGKSKWTFRSRLNLAMDWIIAFSGLPLRIISITGIAVASLGLIYAAFIIINGLSGRLVQGWASTMAAILVLGGIQMMMIGVIGEYLWRNIEESRNRPLYFIEQANFETAKKKDTLFNN
jgi:dolichol-phosphate mannosyltransferase